jgi:hypothetical protein
MSTPPTPSTPPQSHLRGQTNPSVALAATTFALKPLLNPALLPPEPPTAPIGEGTTTNNTQNTNTIPPGPPKQFDPLVQLEYEKTYVNIILCDHEYCPELPRLYMDLVHNGSQLFFPNEYNTFQQCRTDFLDKTQNDLTQKFETQQAEKKKQQELIAKNPQLAATLSPIPVPVVTDLDFQVFEEQSINHCLPMFEPVVGRMTEIIDKHLQYRRERYSTDPLSSNYDAFQFGDPMWFDPNGALNIWRRQRGGSKLVKIEDCAQVVEKYEQCLNDKNNDYNQCYYEHFNSAICEPGFNCPSLQNDILRCSSDPALNTSQKDFENCLQSLPKFLPCAIGEHIERPKLPPNIEGAAI